MGSNGSACDGLILVLRRPTFPLLGGGKKTAKTNHPGPSLGQKNKVLGPTCESSSNALGRGSITSTGIRVLTVWYEETIAAINASRDRVDV